VTASPDEFAHEAQLPANVEHAFSERVAVPIGLEARLIAGVARAPRGVWVTRGERVACGIIVLFVSSYGRGAAAFGAAAVVALLYATLFPLAERSGVRGSRAVR
jgi:hypothetical protein